MFNHFVRIVSCEISHLGYNVRQKLSALHNEGVEEDSRKGQLCFSWWCVSALKFALKLLALH